MHQPRSFWSDLRLLMLVPMLLGLGMVFGAISSRAPVSAQDQQLLAAAQLQAEAELRADHPSRIDGGELSAVDKALLERRIRKINPDGTPHEELWSAASVATGVGGGILFLGGLVAMLLWRGRSSPDEQAAPSA